MGVKIPAPALVFTSGLELGLLFSTVLISQSTELPFLVNTRKMFKISICHGAIDVDSHRFYQNFHRSIPDAALGYHEYRFALWEVRAVHDPRDSTSPLGFAQVNARRRGVAKYMPTYRASRVPEE